MVVTLCTFENAVLDHFAATSARRLKFILTVLAALRACVGYTTVKNNWFP